MSSAVSIQSAGESSGEMMNPSHDEQSKKYFHHATSNAEKGHRHHHTGKHSKIPQTEASFALHSEDEDSDILDEEDLMQDLQKSPKSFRKPSSSRSESSQKKAKQPERRISMTPPETPITLSSPKTPSSRGKRRAKSFIMDHPPSAPPETPGEERRRRRPRPRSRDPAEISQRSSSRDGHRTASRSTRASTTSSRDVPPVSPGRRPRPSASRSTGVVRSKSAMEGSQRSNWSLASSRTATSSRIKSKSAMEEESPTKIRVQSKASRQSHHNDPTRSPGKPTSGRRLRSLSRDAESRQRRRSQSRGADSSARRLRSRSRDASTTAGDSHSVRRRHRSRSKDGNTVATEQIHRSSHHSEHSKQHRAHRHPEHRSKSPGSGHARRSTKSLPGLPNLHLERKESVSKRQLSSSTRGVPSLDDHFQKEKGQDEDSEHRHHRPKHRHNLSSQTVAGETTTSTIVEGDEAENSSAATAAASLPDPTTNGGSPGQDMKKTMRGRRPRPPEKSKSSRSSGVVSPRHDISRCKSSSCSATESNRSFRNNSLQSTFDSPGAQSHDSFVPKFDENFRADFPPVEVTADMELNSPVQTQAEKPSSRLDLLEDIDDSPKKRGRKPSSKHVLKDMDQSPKKPLSLQDVLDANEKSLDELLEEHDGSWTADSDVPLVANEWMGNSAPDLGSCMDHSVASSPGTMRELTKSTGAGRRLLGNHFGMRSWSNFEQLLADPSIASSGKTGDDSDVASLGSGLSGDSGRRGRGLKKSHSFGDVSSFLGGDRHATAGPRRGRKPTPMKMPDTSKIKPMPAAAAAAMSTAANDGVIKLIRASNVANSADSVDASNFQREDDDESQTNSYQEDDQEQEYLQLCLPSASTNTMTTAAESSFSENAGSPIAVAHSPSMGSNANNGGSGGGLLQRFRPANGMANRKSKLPPFGRRKNAVGDRNDTRGLLHDD